MLNNYALKKAIGSVILGILALTIVLSGQENSNVRYFIIDLGTLRDNSSLASDINNAGQIVGQSCLGLDNGSIHAFIYSNNVMRDIGTLGGISSNPTDINNIGQVVGQAVANSDNVLHAFIYSNGKIEDLGPEFIPLGINDSGQIVGKAYAQNYIGAIIYKDNSVVEIGSFGGNSSCANAINNLGQIVGFSDLNNGSRHAFVFDNEVMLDLGTLGGNYSVAYNINNNGTITGASSLIGDKVTHAFLFKNGIMQDIGSLKGFTTTAYSVNIHDQVVGDSIINSQTGETHAFIYSNGVMSDLNNFVDSKSGWILNTATAINDSGQIVGFGSCKDFIQKAFRLDLVSTELITMQPTIPVYGNLPIKEAGKDSLIVITHGWQLKAAFGLPEPDVSWVDRMSNSIVRYLSSNKMEDWQVHGYKWIKNAWTFYPSDALNNAKQEGVNLGNTIVLQGWKNVHFIAHSAGSGLIQAATDTIRNSGLPSSSMIIHETFLDAYVGSDLSGIVTYGRSANWADSYFSKDELTKEAPPFPIGPYTESPTFHSYNVDVTPLDPRKTSYSKFTSSESGIQIVEMCRNTKTTHDWPVDFYMNTIIGNTTSEYAGFGFPLSKEGGNWNSTTTYKPGNGTGVDPTTPTKILGIPDSECQIVGEINPPSFNDTILNLLEIQSIDSQTGTILRQPQSIHLYSGSPVWTTMSITSTNPVNFVSFDARFTDNNSAHGLLTVYWDTNIIGTVDESFVTSKLEHYTFSFPNAERNSTHILGFRLDPSSTTQSSVLLTNIVLNQIGVSQPFSLSIITNTVSGLKMLKLDGETGFDYHVQASTNLTGTNWTNIAILANTNGTVYFYDQEQDKFKQRFYRVIAPY